MSVLVRELSRIDPFLVLSFSPFNNRFIIDCGFHLFNHDRIWARSARSVDGQVETMIWSLDVGLENDRKS